MRIEDQLKENASRRRMWEEMMMHEGWNELVRHLEERYVQAGIAPCKNEVELADRNARLDEISQLFIFIRHDFQMGLALKNEYERITSFDELLPPPAIPM